MAFCNSCGASVDPGIKFCSKCGAPTGVAASASSTTPGTPASPVLSRPPAPPATGGGSAVKIILIVVAVIIVIGILGIASVGFFAYRVAKSAHVHQEGDHVKVETPFGTISANDPVQASKDLGVDIYPGAEVQKNGASSMTFGSIRTVTAQFESSDSMDKVCDFYKSKFPNAATTSSDQNRCTIVSNDQKNMVTINIESIGDHSKFQITNVSKKAN
jgi:hypothetical protein